MNSVLDAGINSQHELALEEHWVNLDGAGDSARMRYLRAGSGPALLLVHGLLGYSFSWIANAWRLIPLNPFDLASN